MARAAVTPLAILAIDTIERSRFQPRTDFDPEQLRELADFHQTTRGHSAVLVRPSAAAMAPVATN